MTIELNWTVHQMKSLKFLTSSVSCMHLSTWVYFFKGASSFPLPLFFRGSIHILHMDWTSKLQILNQLHCLAHFLLRSFHSFLPLSILQSLRWSFRRSPGERALPTNTRVAWTLPIADRATILHFDQDIQGFHMNPITKIFWLKQACSEPIIPLNVSSVYFQLHQGCSRRMFRWRCSFP